MAVRKRRSTSLPVVNDHAAGVDIGHDRHYVCVGSDPDTDVRTFGSFTGDLNTLIDWLVERGVTKVAMESTGVYWIPLFEMLERRGLEVILVDPRQTSRAGNRPKTDVHDCQWIWRLHAHGLLTGSFRPEDSICVLRSYLRQFYRRQRGRIGSPKAITATAHKIARIFYRMLTKGSEYVAKGLDEYERQFRERKLRALQRGAQEFGYTLAPMTPSPVPSNRHHSNAQRTTTRKSLWGKGGSMREPNIYRLATSQNTIKVP